MGQSLTLSLQDRAWLGAVAFCSREYESVLTRAHLLQHERSKTASGTRSKNCSILFRHVYLDIYLDTRLGVLSLGRCFPGSTGIFISLKMVCCHDTATKPTKHFQHWSCMALLFYINRNGRQHHNLSNLVNNAFPCKHGVPKLCLCWSQFSPYELK